MTTTRPHLGNSPLDSGSFAKRPYDLVKEFVVALAVVTLLAAALAAIFSSPDEKAITMQRWAAADPSGLVATATGELAGTTTSATYGAPYNHAATGQQVLGVPLQRWGGVRIPINSADLVLQPLDGQPGEELSRALATWRAAPHSDQVAWASRYAEALAATPNGDFTQLGEGDYGPVPTLATGFLEVARSGGLEGSLTSSGNFYGGDETRSLLLLSDGAFLEDLALAQKLGGDQWGMMNETGNYPGQPWMWLYTFWYQVKPFSTSENADAEVWALMMVFTLLLLFIPLIPGLRDIPRWIPVHRLIWRDYYRRQPKID